MVRTRGRAGDPDLCMQCTHVQRGSVDVALYCFPTTSPAAVSSTTSNNGTDRRPPATFDPIVDTPPSMNPTTHYNTWGTIQAVGKRGAEHGQSAVCTAALMCRVAGLPRRLSHRNVSASTTKQARPVCPGAPTSTSTRTSGPVSTRHSRSIQ